MRATTENIPKVWPLRVWKFEGRPEVLASIVSFQQEREDRSLLLVRKFC